MPVTNNEGQPVPDVTIALLTPNGMEMKSLREIFGNRKVVLLGLPGAFTPVCSNSHLPGFVDLASTFKANGVQEIYCTSVNDPFVMSAWSHDAGVKGAITFLPDGNGGLAKALGVASDFGPIGLRSYRYSMLINDGTIVKQFVEPDENPGGLTVSNAETILNHIAPNAKPKPFVAFLGRDDCSYCAKARALLEKHHQPYEEIDLNDKVTTKALRAFAGVDKATTPQIFIDGRCIGGADDLEALYVKAAEKHHRK